MHRFIAALTVIAAFVVVVPAAAQQAAPDGKTLFQVNCAGCHGQKAIPPATMVKMMKVPALNAAYFAKRTPDSVAVVLKNGRGAMKSFVGKLSPDEMLAIGKFLKQLSQEK
jgi:mono/diheme cytochrome c family protein